MYKGPLIHSLLCSEFVELTLNIGRQGLFFIPVILLLPSYWGLNGVLYAQPVADVFATLMTLFFAIQIHREIRHKSHLTTENLQC